MNEVVQGFALKNCHSLPLIEANFDRHVGEGNRVD